LQVELENRIAQVSWTCILEDFVDVTSPIKIAKAVVTVRKVRAAFEADFDVVPTSTNRCGYVICEIVVNLTKERELFLGSREIVKKATPGGLVFGLLEVAPAIGALGTNPTPTVAG